MLHVQRKTYFSTFIELQTALLLLLSWLLSFIYNFREYNVNNANQYQCSMPLRESTLQLYMNILPPASNDLHLCDLRLLHVHGVLATWDQRFNWRLWISFHFL